MDAENYQVAGRARDTIALPIAAGPATGYSWTLELAEGVEQMEDGPQRTANPEVRLGAATGGQLQVRAAKPGDYVITARLARPWGRDDAVRTVRIELHVE